MTTVINLNILNFFRLKLNKFTQNNVQLHAEVSVGNQKQAAEREDVIDITPYSREVHESKALIHTGAGMPVNPYRTPDMVKRLGVSDKMLPPDGQYRQSRDAVKSSVINGTYDRSGKTVECCQPKGKHIDAYA